MPPHGMDGPPLEKMDASKTQVSACAGLRQGNCFRDFVT